MRKKKSGYGNVDREGPRPFYQRSENRKPVLLFLLPILMALVLAGAIFLAYRESKEGLPTTVSSQTVSNASLAESK